MTIAGEHSPKQRRYSARRQARLDAETHAKLEELASAFHQKGAAVLRSVMRWGLTHTEEWTINRSIPAAAHPLTMLVDPELLPQVQAAAEVHGVSGATWLRQAMRQRLVHQRGREPSCSPPSPS